MEVCTTEGPFFFVILLLAICMLWNDSCTTCIYIWWPFHVPPSYFEQSTWHVGVYGIRWHHKIKTTTPGQSGRVGRPRRDGVIKHVVLRVVSKRLATTVPYTETTCMREAWQRGELCVSSPMNLRWRWHMAAKEDELAGRESSAAPTCGPPLFYFFLLCFKNRILH
jgi:hypothetical protein